MEQENDRDYQGKSLEKICFDGQDLSGADFSIAKLQGSTFRRCILTNADFSQADIRGCDFSEAVLIGAKFDFAQIGTSRKRFSELLLMPLDRGKPPNEDRIIQNMVNEGSRFSPPFSEHTVGPTTDSEDIGSLISSAMASLVWFFIVFFL